MAYVLGVSSAPPVAPKVGHKSPTQAGFAAAMAEIDSFLPSDSISRDRLALESHAFSEWDYHTCRALPGAVLYPRNTEDVVRIVKAASKHSIPVIPYAGGTALEGHFGACATHSNPAESVATELAKAGKHIPVSALVPGLGWSIDFGEMDAIIQVNEDDLDVVVQPGVSYDALNMTLKERGIPLFFPVDPAP